MLDQPRVGASLERRGRCCAAAALVLLAASGCGPSATPAPVSHDAAPQAISAPAPERRPHASPVANHDLSTDETMGGHTLQRHVGKSDAELIARLEREPGISSASTYIDRATAEAVVGAALDSDRGPLSAWLARSGRRPNLVLRYHADHVIGRSMRRGHVESAPCDRALIVLHWDERRQRDYVLTSYPEESR